VSLTRPFCWHDATPSGRKSGIGKGARTFAMPDPKRATDSLQKDTFKKSDAKRAVLPATAYRPQGSGKAYAACKSHFSAILRQWRTGQKRKIADVAGYLGVSTATWGHWETGLYMPSVETLHLVSEITQIPVRYLVCPDSGRCLLSKKHAGGNP